MYSTLRQNLGVPLSWMSSSMLHSWWPTMSAPDLLSLFSNVLSLEFFWITVWNFSFSGRTRALDQRLSSKISSEELVMSQWLNKQRSKLLDVLVLLSTSLLLSPCGLLFVDNCCALGWNYDGLLCGARQVVANTALVKKAIVQCTLSLTGAMATNSVGELTMSLCAGSTDYAPGMTNIFSFFQDKKWSRL